MESNSQSYFRSQRFTVGHLVMLETPISEANIQKNISVVFCFFFNLEKVHQTTWKYGIIKDQYDLEIRDRLPNFMKNFLSKRKFRVQIWPTQSNFCNQEKGVSQASILSVTLFKIVASVFLEENPLENKYSKSHYFLYFFTGTWTQITDTNKKMQLSQPCCNTLIVYHSLGEDSCFILGVSKIPGLEYTLIWK